MAYYVPPSEKLGGHVPFVPHQTAPMAGTILQLEIYPHLFT